MKGDHLATTVEESHSCVPADAHPRDLNRLAVGVGDKRLTSGAQPQWLQFDHSSPFGIDERQSVGTGLPAARHGIPGEKL